MPRRNAAFLVGVNASSRYSKWPVFSCPLMAGFGCPPRVRFERVRAFLEYLERKEADELAAAAARGPFQEALIPQIRNQVESEIDVISKKVQGADVYGRS
jgi:uncharacterized protein YbdZ (MbtH family)